MGKKAELLGSNKHRKKYGQKCWKKKNIIGSNFYIIWVLKLYEEVTRSLKAQVQ